MWTCFTAFLLFASYVQNWREIIFLSFLLASLAWLDEYLAFIKDTKLEVMLIIDEQLRQESGGESD